MQGRARRRKNMLQLPSLQPPRQEEYIDHDDCPPNRRFSLDDTGTIDNNM